MRNSTCASLVFYGLVLVFFDGCRPGSTAKEGAGQTLLGKNEYVEYQPGSLPIIIAVPHGGYLKPAAMAHRNCQDCIYTIDAYTQELARNIATALQKQTGCQPHLIVNRLHRAKLDANRSQADASDGSPAAAAAWREYHQFIEDAKKRVFKQYGAGLLIDLHGHSHSGQRLELGYLLDNQDLRQNDTILNSIAYANRLSVRDMYLKNQNNAMVSELVRGPHSFGTLAHQRGYAAVPSQLIPAPKSGESFFAGGYTIQRHGSLNKGGVDAIQVECNRKGVRDTPANRQKFAVAIAQVIDQYWQYHHKTQKLGASCK